MATSKDVLTEALSLLEKDGWVSGRYGNAFSGYCSYGALDTAASEMDVDYEEGEHLVAQAAGLLLEAGEIVPVAPSVPVTTLIGWNDGEGRTADQVKSLFRTAIQMVEIREDEWDGVPGSEEDLVRNGR